jgi:hypothetical protein
MELQLNMKKTIAIRLIKATFLIDYTLLVCEIMTIVSAARMPRLECCTFQISLYLVLNLVIASPVNKKLTFL